MTRDELLKKICPWGTCDCGDDYESCNCDDCNRVLEEWLYDYEKQVRAKAINDYGLQEAPIYQDDMANQRPVYLAIKNCINGVIEVAERLKEQNK